MFFARDTCYSHEEEGTFRDGKPIGTEHDKNAAGEQEDDAPSESNPEREGDDDGFGREVD